MKKLWNKIGWIINTIIGSAILGASYAISPALPPLSWSWSIKMAVFPILPLVL